MSLFYDFKNFQKSKICLEIQWKMNFTPLCVYRWFASFPTFFHQNFNVRYKGFSTQRRNNHKNLKIVKLPPNIPPGQHHVQIWNPQMKIFQNLKFPLNIIFTSESKKNIFSHKNIITKSRAKCETHKWKFSKISNSPLNIIFPSNPKSNIFPHKNINTKSRAKYETHKWKFPESQIPPEH